jgi:predicted nucleic acid-binding Zn ribbon protein
VNSRPDPQPQAASGEAEALARYRAAARRRRLSPTPAERAAGLGERRRRMLRAVPGTPSGPGPDVRDPQLAGAVWRELADRRGWTNEMALWSLANRWGQIVGPQVAEHVRVVAFDPVPDPVPDPVAADGTVAQPSQTELLPRTAASFSAVAAAPAAGAAWGGKLTLQADSNSWQQQMIWNLAHLQRRLDEELGRGVVGRIVVLGPVQRTRRYGSRRV